MTVKSLVNLAYKNRKYTKLTLEVFNKSKHAKNNILIKNIIIIIIITQKINFVTLHLLG